MAFSKSQALIHCALCSLLLIIGLAACGVASPTGTIPDRLTPEVTLPAFPTVTASPAPSPMPSPQPSIALLLAPPGSDSAQAQSLFVALQGPLAQAGLGWEMRSSLSPADLGEALRLVVALPPDPGLAGLAAAAPQAQFLGVGIPGLQPSPNLSLVGPQGLRDDQQAFMGGVVAALITPDWRVGVVSLSDTVPGKAARQGFLNGAVYVCGLCLAYHGPNVDYPASVELPSSAGAQDWQAAVDTLQAKAVKTVYVFPDLAEEVLQTLAQAGMNLVGGRVPPEALRSQWVASVQADPAPAVLSLLPQLLEGEGGASLPLPLKFTNVNTLLLSPGRQQAAQGILAELLAGYVDSGVDPATGENR